ncbi:venom serine protease Bi-VSP-like [Epargyreus clarus]|uniref:venom serine protease Bi-VSP-like n=1 Tax=Epargyreus clarus TaxID=520877 RepID=UPI003C2F9173
MSFIKKIVLLICIFWCVNAQFDEGDVCEFDNEKGLLGTCKIIHTCEYAQKRQYKDHKHAPTCSYDHLTQIVCCPEDNLLHETGVLSRFFMGAGEGVIRNDDMECRYDGNLPMNCCPKSLNRPQPPEPLQCPQLSKVDVPENLSPAHEVAWKKCAENRRFVEMCLQDKNGKYYRSRVCHVPQYVPRITGEDIPAAMAEFPHMAVLGCTNGDPETPEVDIAWIGGGSLISDKFILTAGHVLATNVHGRLKYALLGTLNKTDLSNGELFNVIRLIPHKFYTSVDKHDDIALIELDRQVRFSEFIRPICLPVPGLSFARTQRTIAGWGHVEYKGNTSETLKKETAYEVHSSLCVSQLVLKGFKWINDTMICAKGEQRKGKLAADTCQGDSGGPLMAVIENRNLDCNYVVTGVVSWGPQCGQGLPGSYTRVSAYLDWIVETVWPKELAKVKDKVAKRGDSDLSSNQKWS